GDEALHAPVLERVEADRRQRSAGAEQPPSARERPVELPELIVDGDAKCLEGALGRVAAAEAGRRRNGGVDRLDQLERGRDGRARAATHDRTGDRRGATLLAEVAQRPRQAALVPLGR